MANKYWYGGNRAGSFIFDSAFADTLDNAAAVDKSTSPETVGIPITGHAFLASDVVTIADTTNYDGTHTILSVTANEIVITAAYVGETFAGTETITAVSNWKLMSDGSSTTKPAAADVIYFNERAADNATTGKKQSMDVDISGADTGTPDLAGVYVTAGFTGDIGASDEYFEFEAVGDDVILQGSGTAYIKNSAGVGSDAAIGRLVIDNAAGTVYLASLENDGANVGLYVLVLAFAGTLNIDAAAAITNLRVIGANAVVVASTGITHTKTTTNVSIIVIAGTITWDSPFLNVTQYGGRFNWGSNGMTATAGLDGTLLKIYPSARFNWQTADTATSILKQFLAYGGTIDAAGSINSGFPKEIGSGSEMSEIWQGATVKLNNGNGNITIAAGSDIESFGGKLIPPVGSVIDW